MGGQALPAVAVLAALAFGAAPASGWYVEGHAGVARAAVDLLPEGVPGFFRGGAGAVAHGAADPDLFKLHATPQLRDGESPEHYLDLEYLQGAPLPEKRYEFHRLLAARGLDPSRVGFLPYAVVEETQRLAIAFAEHRRSPEDPMVRAKVLYFAGVLAHYAGDLCQPLHTTIHYDGRVGDGGRSPRSGIHEQVDSLFGRARVDLEAATRGLRVDVHQDLSAAVSAALAASHRLVDRVYELEAELVWPEGETPSPEVRRFAGERFAASASWTASLLLTAWELSAELDLPGWAEAERRRSRGQPR